MLRASCARRGARSAHSRSFCEDAWGLRRLTDHAGTVHLEPSPELIVERQIASVCHEAMAALASDPYLLARLEAYLGHPIAVLLARFNVGRAICGAGALVALAGPQAFVASSIICGTVMLLEAVGADFEVCPGDFDCDGVPDADDPPPDPGPGGDDGDTYDPGCTSCQPRST